MEKDKCWGECGSLWVQDTSVLYAHNDTSAPKTPEIPCCRERLRLPGRKALTSMENNYGWPASLRSPRVVDELDRSCTSSCHVPSQHIHKITCIRSATGFVQLEVRVDDPGDGFFAKHGSLGQIAFIELSTPIVIFPNELAN